MGWSVRKSYLPPPAKICHFEIWERLRDLLPLPPLAPEFLLNVCGKVVEKSRTANVAARLFSTTFFTARKGGRKKQNRRSDGSAFFDHLSADLNKRWVPEPRLPTVCLADFRVEICHFEIWERLRDLLTPKFSIDEFVNWEFSIDKFVNWEFRRRFSHSNFAEKSQLTNLSIENSHDALLCTVPTGQIFV